MIRRANSFFRLTIVALCVGLLTNVQLKAQDLSDIDMFGNTAQPQEPTNEEGGAVDDDPLNLDDFGADPLEPTPQGEEPQQKTFEEALAEGIAFADKGELGNAIQAFNEILTLGNPSYAPASLELGRAYFELEEYNLARQQFENAQNTGAPFPGVVDEATLGLAEVYMAQRAYADAEEAYNYAVQANPMNAQALLGRAKAQIRSASGFAGGPGAAEVLQSAIDSLDRAIEIDPELGEAYRERLQARLVRRRLIPDNREFKKELEDADKALELEAESANTIGRRAFAYFGSGRNEQFRHDKDLNRAVADFQSAIDGFDSFIALEGNKKFEDYEDADPEDVRLDQILASKAEAQIAIGSELQGGQGYLNEAVATANRLIDFDPDSTAGFYHRGVAQRLLGDLRAAIESWDKALELSPRNSEFHLRRGIAYYYLGEYESARGDFEAAEPGYDGRALFWSGVTFAREGKYEDAVRLYTAALRLAPEFKPAFNNRGLAYMKLGKYSRAEQDFDELVRLDPEDNVARQRRDQARQMSDSDRQRVRTSLYYP